ncbi:MAG: GxxExxY protein [Muribaculaceae bacterium]|nr:GxxExxY protein [Muribaculaceae bacterium]
MDYKGYQDLVYSIVGAAIEVHKHLNWGLQEAIYLEALHMELRNNGINHECEVLLPCFYKGERMNKYYKMDLVAGDVILELKAVNELVPAHRMQLFNYLRLTKKPIGILFNFGEESLRTERYGYDQNTNNCVLLDLNMKPVEKKRVSYKDLNYK